MQQTSAIDTLDPARRFILGVTPSSRLEMDFFNFYAWILPFVGGKRVLDAACGSGLSSFLIAHKAASVLGVDLSEESIAFARAHYARSNVTFEVGDLLTTPLPSRQFDLIVCAFVIEQLSSDQQPVLLQRMRECLQLDGMLILATPNQRVTSPGRLVSGNRWNRHEFTQRGIRRLLDQSGFSVEAVHGQRLGLRLWASLPGRFLIRALERISSRSFGFYGRRESPAVQPLRWWSTPKEFIFIARIKIL